MTRLERAFLRARAYGLARAAVAALGEAGRAADEAGAAEAHRLLARCLRAADLISQRLRDDPPAT